MKLILKIVFGIAFFINSIILFSQKTKQAKDSLLIVETLYMCNLEQEKIEYQDGVYQDYLSKKQAKKIAKMFLFPRYGRFRIWLQYPMRAILYNDYWIFYGRKHIKRRGGVFTVVINTNNACLECITHGK